MNKPKLHTYIGVKTRRTQREQIWSAMVRIVLQNSVGFVDEPDREVFSRPCSALPFWGVASLRIYSTTRRNAYAKQAAA